jgi:hypothetical protein
MQLRLGPSRLGLLCRTGGLPAVGEPWASSSTPTRTADTYSDGDIGLDGGLVQASCRENGGLVRVCMPQRRRRTQKEGAEAEFAVLPTGCRPRRCSGLVQAGGEPMEMGLGELVE